MPSSRASAGDLPPRWPWPRPVAAWQKARPPPPDQPRERLPARSALDRERVNGGGTGTPHDGRDRSQRPNVSTGSNAHTIVPNRQRFRGGLGGTVAPSSRALQGWISKPGSREPPAESAREPHVVGVGAWLAERRRLNRRLDPTLAARAAQSIRRMLPFIGPLLWPTRLAGLVSPSVSPAVTPAAAGALLPVPPLRPVPHCSPQQRNGGVPTLPAVMPSAPGFSLARNPLEVATWPRSSSFWH